MRCVIVLLKTLHHSKCAARETPALPLRWCCCICDCLCLLCVGEMAWAQSPRGRHRPGSHVAGPRAGFGGLRPMRVCLVIMRLGVGLQWYAHTALMGSKEYVDPGADSNPNAELFQLAQRRDAEDNREASLQLRRAEDDRASRIQWEKGAEEDAAEKMRRQNRLREDSAKRSREQEERERQRKHHCCRLGLFFSRS